MIARADKFGRSLRFFHILKRNCLLILSPSCFAVRGLHLSLSDRFFSTLYSSVPNPSMFTHSSDFIISSSNTSRSSLYISHFPATWVLLSIVAPHVHIFIATSSSSRLLVHISFLILVGPGPPDRKRSFSFSRSALGRANTLEREGGGGEA